MRQPTGSHDRCEPDQKADPDPQSTLIAELSEQVLARLAERELAPGLSPWLTVPQAARYISLSVDHLYRLTAARAIPHRRIGRTIRLHRDELDQWLDTQRAGHDHSTPWPSFPERPQPEPRGRTASEPAAEPWRDGS